MDAALDPAHIGDAIVFVLARWSPDAVMRWDDLQEALARAGYRGRLVLVDPDARGFDPITFAARYGFPLHGWGETFLISQGHIVARSSAEHGPSLSDLVERALT